MSADFKVNGFFIEFIGLQGELKVYDDALIRKEKMWEGNHLNVIKIYPEDLFPENKLNLILKNILFNNSPLTDKLNQKL